jgi:hypothetical protein
VYWRAGFRHGGDPGGPSGHHRDRAILGSTRSRPRRSRPHLRRGRRGRGAAG